MRLRVHGTPDRPRLIIQRSLKNLYAQVIDDTESKTIFSSSTLDKEIREKFPYAGNIKAAEFFSQVFAGKLKDKGIKKIVFDRAGYLYHGRIKAFADGLRKQGFEF